MLTEKQDIESGTLKPKLNNRVDDLIDFPFTKLRELIGEHQPPDHLESCDVSIGQPQSCPEIVKDSFKSGDDNWGKYPSLDGDEAFRNAVKGYCERRFNIDSTLLANERTILPTSGTREAIFMLAMTVLSSVNDTGKKPVVLVPNPYYAGYPGSSILSGAETVYVEGPKDGESFFENVSEEILDETVLMFLCSPNNPTGKPATFSQLKNAIKTARKHNFVLVVDECNIDLYLDSPPIGALEVCNSIGEGLDNLVVIQSLSKRSSSPGLRSGVVIGDPEVLQKFWLIRCFGGSTIPVPILETSTKLWKDDVHVEVTRAELRERFNIAEKIIGNRFDFYRPGGGFFLWLNVGDGEKAAVKLWTQKALKVMPGAYLCKENQNGNPGRPFIRVALLHKPEIVKEIITRIDDCLE